MTQGPFGRISSSESLAQAAINRLHSVERCSGLGNLDFARYESFRPSSLLAPSAKKCLSATIITTDGFEATAPKCNAV